MNEVVVALGKLMRPEHAGQIAQLLNRRNQLKARFDAETIRRRAANFLVDLDGDQVLACIEINRIQWYQWEISHLAVTEKEEGKGHARQLIACAEERALRGNARIIQCTIRVGNERSEHLFQKCGYQMVSTFFYPHSGHNVGVWQKVVSRPITATPAESPEEKSPSPSLT